MAALSDLQKPSPAIAIGSTSLSAATGNVAVTGVGFKPTWIVCYGVHEEAPSNVLNASGYYDGNTYDASAQTVYGTASATSYYNSTSGTRFYDAYDESANRAAGNIASFDDDGFTIDRDFGGFAVVLFWIVGR